ncbi:class I SAM-dependent methyltransferase [Nannocystis pusilla]|uniref:Class I SAM-dependent methyltransferase n=1 Tax=Nannocystis pusilla TaxID=889268 RepID=A0ABS7TMB0_9BACT|nr:class I SAM-dependent methyltransferase [Nannocystis pusilla]MBZ5709362.1 class I SAM-dependent methyltransferase [Nannocystis pusilla]
MSLPKLAARVVLGYVGLVEGTAALIRFRERSTAFQMAAERATALGRRLVVIGDPDAGMHTRLMRAYGCGDVCIDMNGCPGCPITIVADITKGPVADIPDDSAVVFVSCVLEYVSDLHAALREIARIAGSAENVFVVTVQPWTLTARLYPGARWRGTVSNVAGAQAVDMKPVALEEKLAVTGALGLAFAAAFWPKGRK